MNLFTLFGLNSSHEDPLLLINVDVHPGFTIKLRMGHLLFHYFSIPLNSWTNINTPAPESTNLAASNSNPF